MSIIRNARNRFDKTITIKRFVADESIDSNGYKPVAYVEMNNYYMQATAYVHLALTTSFIVKAEIDEDAEGPLMGRTDGLKIIKTGSNIKWYNNTTEVRSEAWKSGTHLYGFAFINGSLKAFYDGTTSGTISSANMGSLYFGILSGSSDNAAPTGDAIHSTNTWALRIYEAIGNISYKGSTGSATTYSCHFYATHSGANAYLFETLSNIGVTSMLYSSVVGSTISGVTSRIAYGSDVTYGVQLHDLKDAFGSSYKHDLVAILAQDNGVDTALGWEQPAVEPDILVKADTAETFTIDDETHTLAFYIPSDRIPGTPTVTAPSGYAAGELIRGRQGKWSIWSDALNVFRYLKAVPSGSQGQNTAYEMHCNLFYDPWGRDMTAYAANAQKRYDMLGCFDGYSTKSDAIHKPAIEVSVPVSMHIYNGTPFEPNDDIRYSSNCYPYSITGNGTVKGKVGNLAWWNLTRTEQQAPAGVSSYLNLSVYGMMLRGQINDANSETGYREIFQMLALSEQPNGSGGMIPLSAESWDSDTDPINVKKKFQREGVTAQLRYTDLSFAARIEAVNGDLKTRYTMSLPMSSLDSDLGSGSFIDCSALVPAIDAKTQIYQHYSDMHIVGEEDGKAVIYINNTAQYLNIHISGAEVDNAFNIGGSSADRYGFGIRFTVADDSKNIPTLYNTVSGSADLDPYNPKIVAYVEYNRMASISSYVLQPASNIHGYDTHFDFPASPSSGHAYIERKTNTAWWYVNKTEYTKLVIQSYPTMDDFPSGLNLYSLIDGPFNQNSGEHCWIYGDNKYIHPTFAYANSQSAFTDNRYKSLQYVLIKRFGDDQGSLWIYRSSNWVQVIPTRINVKEEMPELGDYYYNEADGKHYRLYESGSAATVNFYTVECTIHSYASRSAFPVSPSGDTPIDLYLAEDTDTYYNYKTGGHYKQDEEVAYASQSNFPSSGEVGIIYVDNATGYRYRWGKATSDAASNTYVRISRWYDNGEMLERRCGFCTPTALAWPGTQPNFPKQNNYHILGDASTLDDYKYKDTNINIHNSVWDKYAVALFYNKDLAQGGDELRQSAYNQYAQPSSHTIAPHYHIYDRDHAPHAWGVLTSIGGATFNDQCENWVFYANESTYNNVLTRFYYAVVDNGSHLLGMNDRLVVSCYLRLYRKEDEAYHELLPTADNFKPFKLTLYKQSACRAFVYDQNDNVVYDSTYGMTEVFSNKTINAIDTTFTEGDYEIKLYSNKIYEGYGMTMEGTVKSGIFNAESYYLEIKRKSSASLPDNATTYLFTLHKDSL